MKQFCIIFSVPLILIITDIFSTITPLRFQFILAKLTVARQFQLEFSFQYPSVQHSLTSKLYQTQFN